MATDPGIRPDPLQPRTDLRRRVLAGEVTFGAFAGLASAVSVEILGRTGLDWVILDLEQWETLAARLKDAGTKFIVEPYVRFKGMPGEQATMFFLDPFGNALEFKAFGDINLLFAKNG